MEKQDHVLYFCNFYYSYAYTFGVVMLMVLNLNGMVFQTGEKLDKVVFFLKDDAKPKDVNAFIDELDENKKVKKLPMFLRKKP